MNNSPPQHLAELQTVFRSAERERLQLRNQMLASTNSAQTISDLATIISDFKSKVGDKLKPLLEQPSQVKKTAEWIARAPAGGRGFCMPSDPNTILRNFLPLEPSYFFLSTKTNTDASDLVKFRDIYQEAIHARDSLTNEVAKLMGSPGMGRTDDREGFESQLQTISLGVENRFRATLKPHHIRELATWQAQQPNGFARKKSPKDLPGKSAFVFIDPKAEDVKLCDCVQLTERSGGYKVRLGKGQRLEGNSVINIVFDTVPRRLLNEPLAYEFHRRVGNPVYFSSQLRLSVDGNLIGYHYLFGQPNKTFLKQNGLSDSGNLYKAYWMGRGLTGRHVKKSNPHSGHDDLIKLVKTLEETKSDPDAQWELLQREFDIPQLINHYAARMVLSDWDGFFNNYYLFHDTGGKKKWFLFVWDEDKTWGDYDGMAENRLLYKLPWTYGADNDARPTNGEAFWWRSGGYVSRPVLAHPHFRALYLSRVREILQTEFTEAKLFPLIDQYGERLRPRLSFALYQQSKIPRMRGRNLRIISRPSKNLLQNAANGCSSKRKSATPDRRCKNEGHLSAGARRR